MFDSITKDDLIVAFYPCIYFCSASQMNMGINSINLRKLNNEEKIKKIIERSNNRQDFYNRLIKFCGVCIRNGFRMVFENPWAEQTYLKANFIKPPEVIDIDRTNRGDYFVKPTAFWFWNCEPTNGNTYQKSKAIGSVFEQKQASRAGLCSEERSMISPDYARNWICDFILGKKQEIGQLSLF